jgi:uncharacterized membrane protein
MADIVMLVLRVLHLFCGAFWVGGALVGAFFLGPAVQRMGPDGGRFMHELMQRRRFGLYMTLAGGFTVLTGLAFLGHGMSSEVWRASTYGRTMMTGSALGVLALVLGHSVNAPTAKRLGALGAEMQAAGGPRSPDQHAEVARLQRRLRTASVAVAILLSLTVVAMAAASAL